MRNSLVYINLLKFTNFNSQMGVHFHATMEICNFDWLFYLIRIWHPKTKIWYLLADVNEIFL